MVDGLLLGLVVPGRASAAVAATGGTGTVGGWFALLGAAAVGALGYHLVGRARRARAARETANASPDPRLAGLLAQTDWLMWEAEVRMVGDALTWQFTLQPSGLSRRIFGDAPWHNDQALWAGIELPDREEMDRRCREALRAAEPGYAQKFRVRRAGGEFHLHESVSVQRVDEGLFRLIGLITDRTAQEEAERARHASEEQLKQLMTRADCMLWQAEVTRDEAGHFSWEWFVPKSELYRRIVGEDPERQPSMPWGRMAVPEFDEIEARSRHAMEHNLPGYEQEFRVIKGSDVMWMHEQTSITPRGRGQWKLEGVVIDVTARRRAEEGQRTSDIRLHQLLERADCTIWHGHVSRGPDERLIWSLFIPPSRLCRRIYGHDPEGDTGFRWGELGVPEYGEMQRTSREAVFGGAPGYEQVFHVPKLDGHIWLSEQVSITPAGPDRWDLVGVITDITARREAEEARQASEAQLRQILEQADCMVWQGTATRQVDGSFVWSLYTPRSVLYQRLFGSRPEGTVLDWRLLEVPESAEMARRADHALRSGAPGYNQEFRVIKPTGTTWLNEMVTVHPVSPTELRLVGVITDVTARREAEIGLAAEKERLAVTLRAMAESVVTTDLAGRVQFMNPAAAALTQWDGAALGRPVAEICPLQNSRTGEVFPIAVDAIGGRGVVVDLPPQTALLTRKGERRLVQGCCTAIHTSDARLAGLVLVFRDVTEQERLEQELVRATRLESVGILAGGIAHDFNNILTAIMGNLAMAGQDVGPLSAVGERLREAEKATLRARDLTQQLLIFAKGGEPVRAAVQLEAVIREEIAFALLGSSVKATFDLPADLWPADADKGQLGRVVQNLAINAVQAMPRGGTLQVAARNEQIDGTHRPGLTPGRYLRLQLTDGGEGIRPEHLPRIFDPYFTTKETGSGLGLAAVYSIVRKHGGSIDVESQWGQGTTFRLWLPAKPGPAAPAEAESRWDQLVLRGRVLFMDDEEIIRQMATMLLRRLGLEVACVADGVEAVDRFQAARAEGKPFSLVIMDLTVPGGMGGRDAIARLREIDPAVKAIVSSGYSSDPIMANYRAHGFCGMVAKPYRVEDFVRVLRTALDEGGTSGAGSATTRLKAEG